jgi:hypothetical protein
VEATITERETGTRITITPRHVLTYISVLVRHVGGINVLTCHRFKTLARHRYDKTRPLSLELPAQNGRTSLYCFSWGSLTRGKCFVQSVRPPADLATVKLWNISESVSFIEQTDLKKSEVIPVLN